MAGNNEVLIGGKFSPDVELTASHEKQIGGVTVKYENFGAALDKKGESKTLEYVTLQAAQEELNHLKNSGQICGAVHISYALAEKSGRSYTQYLTEREPDPTPAPPINQSGATNTVAKPTPTAAPTPKVTSTPAPTATPKPTSTPKPTAVPFTTPIPNGQLTIACASNKTGRRFLLRIAVQKPRAEGSVRTSKLAQMEKSSLRFPLGCEVNSRLPAIMWPLTSPFGAAVPILPLWALTLYCCPMARNWQNRFPKEPLTG